MTRGAVASLASVATIFVICVAYVLLDVVRVDWFTGHLTATMQLSDSGGLLPRSPVLLSGVRVGQVTAVTHTRGAVEVTMRIDNTYRIPAASTVRIDNQSFLGEPDIEFIPAADSGPYLHDGDTIDTATIRTPTSIPQFARALTDLLNQLDPQVIKSIIDTFSTGLAGTESVIPQLARSTDLLAATMLSRTQTIRDLLDELQKPATDLDWAGAALSAASGPWAGFGPKISEGAAAIGRLATTGQIPDDYLTGTGLIPFAERLTQWLHRAGPDLQTLAPALQPLLTTATGVAGRIDLSALITQALATTSDDGALHLQITIK
ncbi:MULTISPECIES: MlaD family protein [unclassified Nocardia]|uniref:MlaD family protein n=1 Tax=unclassified Nocardia TaxID=2637762 RepID=UPI001CE46671|nr:MULTISPECIES: MlaD family protein [unclassified Nocardia]